MSRHAPFPYSAAELDQFRQVVEVNLIGSFNLLRLAAADMAGLDALDDGERGVILLTASVAASFAPALEQPADNNRRANPTVDLPNPTSKAYLIQSPP